jgi:uroporphyrinogen-III decarboxylase
MMNQHPVKGPEDFLALEYIFEHAEFIPEYSQVEDIQAHLGEIGFVAPMLNRIPFQQLTLDHVGEVSFFYMLYDHPELVDKMMHLLDQVMLEDLRQVASYSGSYVQFDDNLDGMITNPRLFETYCLPHFQRYTDELHAQGKKVGSHTDGNLKRLLVMLTESGLDVCESFSPAPLTECSFDEASQAWKDSGPMIWGGIPSSILEPQVSEVDFIAYVDHVLQSARLSPMILGIGDMVMSNNLIERVRTIAERVEELNL